MRAHRGAMLMAVAAGWAVCAVPELAAAAEATTKAVAEAPVAWQTSVGNAIGAGFTMGVSALAAGYAQSKIGAAGAGTLAERPEAATTVIVLQALPEIIALLGFAIAFMIIGA